VDDLYYQQGDFFQALNSGHSTRLKSFAITSNILGHKVFDTVSSTKDTTKERDVNFHITSVKGAKAIGEVHPEGFLVAKGSSIASETTKSFEKHNFNRLRERLISEKVVIAENNELRFLSDYIFNSASAAAAIVLGRSANGLTEWRTDNGQDLKSFGDSNG